MRQEIAGGYVLLSEPQDSGLQTWDSGLQPPDPGLQTPQVGFAVAAYDTSRPLIIDPELSYSTYLGGSGRDQGNGIAVDTAGSAYVTGSTTSTNFPTTAGSFQPAYRGSFDAYADWSATSPHGCFRASNRRLETDRGDEERATK